MSALAPRLRLTLDPLIAEAKRRARRRRLLTAAVLALVVAGGVLAATPTRHPPVASSSAGAGTVSDGVLRVALPPGWTASIGPGFYRTHPEAWVLLGDFRLPPGAARHEGAPGVPGGKVLVSVGDFFPQSRSSRTVTSLRMPRALIVQSRWWSVRYAGRALSIRVTFGSGPTTALVRDVGSLLRGIQRVR